VVDAALLAQHAVNALMLGIMYALVAVGFTLFFGVLDVIKFSHGDVLTVGAFTGLTVWLALVAVDLATPWLAVALLVLVPALATALLGALIGRFVVLPLKGAPPLNVLLATLMCGTILREAIRLFYPGGANPKPFPALLPTTAYQLGNLNLRLDSVLLFLTGVAIVVALHLVINRTRLGLAIRAVAQDAEIARVMGIDHVRTVLITFAIGSALAAVAGIMHGLYYNEINFSMGLLLGVIGFSSAVVGGLGNVYGAILGGFLFAFLQTLGAMAMPFASAYRDVFAFAVVIAIMAVRPTGLIAERGVERA